MNHELSREVTDAAQLSGDLQERLRFETLLSDISSKFVNLPASEVDREIMDAEHRICNLLGLDLSAIWQWSVASPGIFTFTHFCGVVAGPQPPEQMNAQKYFPWLQSQMLAVRIIAFSSLDELPPEAARDQETFRQFNIKSALVIPLSVGGDPPIGVLGLNTTREECDWPPALVQRLKLVAQIFANALARKTADLALRESEARVSLAAEAANAGLWSLELKTGRIWLTNKTRELFGLVPETEFTLERFLHLVHPDDRKEVQETIQSAVRSKSDGHVEYRVGASTTQFRWMSARGRVHCDASGEPDRLMGVTVDITDRKLAELALQARQERLAAAVEVADLGFYEIHGVARREFFDGLIRSILGLPDDAAPNAREFWVAHLHPEDRERILDLSRQVFEGPLNHASAEYRYLHPQRGMVWLRQISRVFERDAQGRMVRLTGVIQDITHRKTAEEKVSQLTHAVEQSPVLILITDPQGQIVYVNRKFSEVTGYAPDESHGQNPRFLKSGESPPGVYQELWTCITGGRTWRGEFHNRKKNGELYWESAVISPLLDGNGKITHFVGIKEDITTHKRAEAEITRQRNELAHLSRVTTLSELSGSLAHELNQPLGIILSNAQAAQELLALNPPEVAEVSEILADIVAADRRASEVIQRLRALMKRGETSRQPLQLNELIEEVLNLVRADLIGRGVTPVCNLAADLPLIAGDRVQVQQLALNLILNAADAMAENAPDQRRLYVTTLWREQTVCVSVRDEGAGLPGDIDQIFQPFYTTKAHGLGMGLAICRSIITAHQGKLWAEPHPTRGAVFHFELPVAEEGR